MAIDEGDVSLLKRTLQGLANSGPCPSRRRFLTLATGAMISAGSLVSMPALAKSAFRKPERALSIYNLHTGESVNAVYWANGAYVGEAIAEINHLMRDFRTDQVKAIHPQLLNLMYAISNSLGAARPIELISGYRSPDTNALLRERSNGVAKHSLHMDGMASDIRIAGHDLGALRKVALSLHAGGVGYYPQSDFVHVDVGPVRHWNGA
jgi:uncharacterized protein YcbK (DUF882 family)